MMFNVPYVERLRGTATVPGDKSISHRALIIASLADGTSEIIGLSRAKDPLSTAQCLRQLGVEILEHTSSTKVRGGGLRGLKPPRSALDAGNSGTTIRLLSGVLAGQSFSSTLVGDASLSRRPMRRVLEPLRQMGAAISADRDETPPVSILPSNGLHGITYRMPVASAQVKSAILLAGLFAEGKTRVIESTATRDHTERILGLHVEKRNGESAVEVTGGTGTSARRYEIPGDPSSACFLVAAALVTPGSSIRILNVGLNPLRRHAFDMLKDVGGRIELENLREVSGEPVGDIVASSSDLHGAVRISSASVASVIDEVPILAVTMMCAGGSFELHGGDELRRKESDRIAGIVWNLRKAGLDVEEYPDGFAFEGKKDFIAADFESFDDHRLAMAFGMAGMRKPGSRIRNAQCVEISFPGFWETLTGLSIGRADIAQS